MTPTPDAPSPDGNAEDARTALDALYVAAYEELRRLASRVASRDANRTLSPTALVHEAWMKLARSPGFESSSELHFKHIAARAMRQVLVEAARRRLARKRAGGADVALVEFDDEALVAPTATHVVAVDDALSVLARANPRQALVVEARFFGGLTVPEVALVAGVSEVTVMRDWRVARAWLNAELTRA